MIDWIQKYLERIAKKIKAMIEPMTNNVPKKAKSAEGIVLPVQIKRRVLAVGLNGCVASLILIHAMKNRLRENGQTKKKLTLGHFYHSFEEPKNIQILPHCAWQGLCSTGPALVARPSSLA
jgi:hypothetical protein